MRLGDHYNWLRSRLKNGAKAMLISVVTMLLTLIMSNNTDFCFVFEFVDQGKRIGPCWGSKDSGVFLDSVGEVQSRT